MLCLESGPGNPEGGRRRRATLAGPPAPRRSDAPPRRQCRPPDAVPRPPSPHGSVRAARHPGDPAVDRRGTAAGSGDRVLGDRRPAEPGGDPGHDLRVAGRPPVGPPAHGEYPGPELPRLRLHHQRGRVDPELRVPAAGRHAAALLDPLPGARTVGAGGALRAALVAAVPGQPVPAAWPVRQHRGLRHPARSVGRSAGGQPEADPRPGRLRARQRIHRRHDDPLRRRDAVAGGRPRAGPRRLRRHQGPRGLRADAQPAGDDGPAHARGWQSRVPDRRLRPGHQALPVLQRRLGAGPAADGSADEQQGRDLRAVRGQHHRHLDLLACGPGDPVRGLEPAGRRRLPHLVRRTGRVVRAGHDHAGRTAGGLRPRDRTAGGLGRLLRGGTVRAG